jgi:dihydrolipoamide dehydrogenase
MQQFYKKPFNHLIMNKIQHDTVIIGAGPGGYRAAFMAADLGQKVTLIDPNANPGGVCLYKGCIPTKALLHLVKVKKEALAADEMGITFDEPKIDIEQVAAWKNDVVKTLTGGLGQLVKARKINYIKGYAQFINSDTLEIDKGKDEKEKIQFKNAIIATGVSPVVLPDLEPDGKLIIGSEQALELKEIPKRLLVIGGGYIGLETATIYAGLGSEVSITELTDDFMPGTDKDLVREFKQTNKETFKETFTGTKTTKIDKKGDKVTVSFENKKGDSFERTYDKILVSVGQKPNSKNLGLENTKVETDEKGYIKIDKQQRTNDEHIFAIGDISGGPLLAHKASYEGRVAAEVISGKKAFADAKTIPAVAYTSPEIATAGLTETEANNNDIEYKVVKFPWAASGRAVAMNEKRGFTKLLIDPKTERILGAGIVGKNAGDIISELALAIEMAATAEDVALTVHPHPTLSETIMEAAEIFYGHPAHTMPKK